MSLTDFLMGLFNTLLVAFAGLTWWVYRKLAKIEEENQRTRLDPDLMVVGTWSYKAPDGGGFSECTAELWFCNPGPTPIFIRRRDYEASEHGAMRAYDEKTTKLFLKQLKDGYNGAVHAPTYRKRVIPGYGSEDYGVRS